MKQVYFIIHDIYINKGVDELVTLSELQAKEIVMMHNGKRLGHIVDLEIDVDSGFITGIIILDKQEKGSFFQKPVEKRIAWEQIMTIGADIILIQEDATQQNVTEDNKIE
jgi:YlmC/YmxH family sporulation protein